MDNREYTSVAAFEHDVLIIFSNCYKYNPPEHDVVGMARRLEEVFRARLARMRDRSPEEGGAGLARLQEPPSGSAPPPSDSGGTGDSSDWNKRLMQVQEQMRQLNQQIQML